MSTNLPPDRKIANLCRSCDEDFGSLAAFDRHRSGTHAYLWSSDRPDGRRCLDVEEMKAAGLALNKLGGWSIGKDLQSIREAFLAPTKDVLAA